MVLSEKQMIGMYESIAGKFAGKAEELCTMDARLGDGDLGITMKKGFSVVPGIIAESTETDLGKKLMKAGMKMASTVPSTMGTLMSSGIMSGGKKLAGKNQMGPEELAEYLLGFAEGIIKRGKCQEGDRTVLDSVGPAARSAQALLHDQPGATLVEVILTAYDAALTGVEATRNMVPKFGKAAVHKDACAGNRDQGALAGAYMIEGMKEYILREAQV